MILLPAWGADSLASLWLASEHSTWGGMRFCAMFCAQLLFPKSVSEGEVREGWSGPVWKAEAWGGG